jgi:hypothetical protein
MKDLREQMSKRFQVTLPDALYQTLEEWAVNEGRPVANLAAYLLELSIRQRLEKETTSTSKGSGK